MQVKCKRERAKKIQKKDRLYNIFVCILSKLFLAPSGFKIKEITKKLNRTTQFFIYVML